MPRCRACGKKNLSGFAFCQKCGAPLDAGEDQAPEAGSQSDRAAPGGVTGEADGFEEQIAQLLEQGEKIEAIKLYRQRTGAGLAEAKQAVERLQVDVIFAESDIEEQLLALLRQGRKIEAIRTYRQRTQSSLVDAKAAVEALATKHGIETRRAGCALMLLFALLVAGGLFTTIFSDRLEQPL
jgi:ribosomal protein L7/L12